MGKNRTEQERTLYPNIAKIFEDRGYNGVIYKRGVKGYEFVIYPSEEKDKRKIDLVAYKHDKDLENIETIAVEVKNTGSVWDDINDALAQATDCLPYFDEVYIGAGRGDIPSDKKRLLKNLNVGLITAEERKGEKGKIELNPTKVGIFDPKRRGIVKSKIIAPKIFKEVFDEIKKTREKKFGKLKELLSEAEIRRPPSENPHEWIAIEPESEIQFQASCDREYEDTKEAAASSICINLETTWTIRKIFRGFKGKNVDKFFQILRKLQKCHMDLGEYPFKNGRKVISEYVDIFEHKELGKNLTRKEFEKISSILKKGYSDPSMQKNHHLHLQFWIDMWKTREKLTKNEYKKRMFGAVNRLKNLYIFLEERYSE